MPNRISLSNIGNFVCNNNKTEGYGNGLYIWCMELCMAGILVLLFFVILYVDKHRNFWIYDSTYDPDQIASYYKYNLRTYNRKKVSSDEYHKNKIKNHETKSKFRDWNDSPNY